MTQCLFAFGKGAVPGTVPFCFKIVFLFIYTGRTDIPAKAGGVDDAKAKDRSYAFVG